MRPTIILVALLAAAAAGGAQQSPPIRQLGRVERTSTDSLASVAAALSLPGGRVLVNDITGRRVLLLDSTLSHPIVVADTTSATANAYGRSPGTLIRYRADTALYIDRASLSMLVIDPGGKIGRVMAIPRPDDAQFLIGSIFGTPGFDAHGRLIYYKGEAGGFFVLRAGGRIPIDPATGKPRLPPRPPEPDSAVVLRVDLATRTMDTVAIVKIPKSKFSVNIDAEGYTKSTQTAHDPIPIVDAWTVLPDGSVAVVRGRDYHIDWLSADGHWSSSPKMPFGWQRLSDDRKLAIADSVARGEQAMLDSGSTGNTATCAATPSRPGAVASTSAGRGGSGASSCRQELPMVAGRLPIAELSDYVPAFKRDAVSADADGNLWIRTSAEVKGLPVYDIVNRRGELTDRVQLPPFRTIAGFGPGVVYLAVKDPTGIVHLERARVR